PRLGRQPGATAAAELLVGLVRSATRRAGRGERGPAFPAESALGAVVVVAGRAAHRGVSRARDYHAGRKPRNSPPVGVVSRPESRDSATASAFGTWPWRDTSGPDLAAQPEPAPGARSTTIANTSGRARVRLSSSSTLASVRASPQSPPP